MIAELGYSAVIAAFIIATLMPFIGLLGFKKAPVLGIKIVTIAQRFNFSLIAIAFLSLAISFLTSNFSLKTVLLNSEAQEAWIIRLIALWSNHEGSLLLWILTLSGYGVLLSFSDRKRRDQPIHFYPHFFLHLIIAGFLGFLVILSNPFETLSVAPLQGLGMNPLLQDPAMTYHPPTLYFGYVGFVIPFVIALSILVTGTFTTADAIWLRHWTLLAWLFLTLGITAGSFWAYYELGWGGWWFWDPVENASLLPWLTATALVHTLTVARKTDQFKRWSLFLALVTFLLSMLGTYITRSGIVASVHGFAQDDTRGLYLLLFTGLLTVLALGIFCRRVHTIPTRPLGQLRPKLIGGHIGIMLFVGLILILGTFFPLLSQAWLGQEVILNESFYNRLIVPFGIGLLMIMGLIPWVSGHKFTLNTFLTAQGTWINLCLAAFVLLLFMPGLEHFLGISTIAASLWVIIMTGRSAILKGRAQPRIAYNSWAMFIAHLGLALMALGMGVDVTFTQEQHVWLAPKQHSDFMTYRLTLKEVQQSDQGTYLNDQAKVEVFYEGQSLTVLKPARRLYKTKSVLVAKTAIFQHGLSHLYLVLGPALQSGERSLKMVYHPLVFLIWLGGILMALAALLSLGQRRKERQKSAPIR
jgi:cytochrome c-type biogenesis protein CcmF